VYGFQKLLLGQKHVFQHAMFASQVWDTDLLHPSLFGQFDCNLRFYPSFGGCLLALRESVARASLVDEIGVHPLKVHWLEACVTFFRAACAS
jgi:hypothetical protein